MADQNVPASADICTIMLGQGNVVVSAARSNVQQTPMPGQIAIVVDLPTFQAARSQVGLCTWDGKALQPYAPPPPPVPIPLAVTRLQGRLALSRAGLLAKAEAAVAQAGGETAIWYDDAQTWGRNDPHVLAVAQALGLASDDLDKLFAEAAAI